MNRRRLTHWLETIWYGSRPVERTLLLPLSALFCLVAARRRQRFVRKQHVFDVPVVVVGNIAVGGTGKTPLTMRLVKLLEEAGYRPGIVSRGYGSQPDKTMIRPVTYHNKPEDVGDEALMMATRTSVPVVVGIQRNRAVDYMLENYDVDVVLSDDGLQHYALARDMEIAVIDGGRRYGNGYCLPAGPLRERPQRLQDCDFVVANGQAQQDEYLMTVSGHWLVSVANPRVSRPVTELSGKKAHVVSAIGNPQRFLDALQRAGIECKTHLYPDHYLFAADDFSFEDELLVLMTEKDAVKCRQFKAELVRNCWYLAVDAQVDKGFELAFLEKIEELKTDG